MVPSIHVGSSKPTVFLALGNPAASSGLWGHPSHKRAFPDTDTDVSIKKNKEYILKISHFKTWWGQIQNKFTQRTKVYKTWSCSIKYFVDYWPALWIQSHPSILPAAFCGQKLQMFNIWHHRWNKICEGHFILDFKCLSTSPTTFCCLNLDNVKASKKF